jgi:hypothetical protein
MNKPRKGRKKSCDTDSEGPSIIFGDGEPIPTRPQFHSPTNPCHSDRSRNASDGVAEEPAVPFKLHVDNVGAHSLP